MFKKPIAHVLFYILSAAVLYFAHKIDPTDLAGPGLDILVLLLLIFAIPTLLIVSLKKQITRYSKICISIIHIIGLGLIFWWLSLPS